MSVQSFRVEAKKKRFPLVVASAGDFDLAPDGAGMAIEEIFANPDIAPYCFDQTGGKVLMVETGGGPPSSGSAFFYERQYLDACRVHAVDLEIFLEAALDLPECESVTVLHSTGRCGSTLFSRIVETQFAADVLSEPDIFTQLAMTGPVADPEDAKIYATVYDAILRFFARTKPHGLVVKLRSAACRHADIIGRDKPGVASAFLYRNAFDVVRSYARIHGRPLSGWVIEGDALAAFMPFASAIGTLDGPVDGFDLMCGLWASPVLSYLDTAEQGLWRGSATYEQLIAEPEQTVLRLTRNECGLARSDQSAASAIERHSQSGSHLAPERLRLNPALECELAAADFEPIVRERLLRIDPRLRPDIELP